MQFRWTIGKFLLLSLTTLMLYLSISSLVGLSQSLQFFIDSKPRIGQIVDWREGRQESLLRISAHSGLSFQGTPYFKPIISYKHPVDQQTRRAELDVSFASKPKMGDTHLVRVDASAETPRVELMDILPDSSSLFLSFCVGLMALRLLLRRSPASRRSRGKSARRSPARKNLKQGAGADRAPRSKAS